VGESLNVDDVLSGRPGRPGNWAVEEYETLTKEPTCPIGPTICGSACCGVTFEVDGFGQNFRVSFIQPGVGMGCGYERGFMLRPIGDAIPLHVRGSESFPCFVLSFHSEQDCLSSFALRKIVPPWAWAEKEAQSGNCFPGSTLTQLNHPPGGAHWLENGWQRQIPRPIRCFHSYFVLANNTPTPISTKNTDKPSTAQQPAARDYM
jgi:hypothetical protein